MYSYGSRLNLPEITILKYYVELEYIKINTYRENHVSYSGIIVQSERNVLNLTFGLNVFRVFIINRFIDCFLHWS